MTGTPRAGVAGADDAAMLLAGDPGGSMDDTAPAALPGEPSSVTGGMTICDRDCAGRFTMARTYCRRTASLARAAAPMTAFLCAFCASTTACAARFSRTCSGVSPWPSMRPVLHRQHSVKSASRHRTRQHRWYVWLHSVVNNSRFTSSMGSPSSAAASARSSGE
jgi:hypothetical protein